MITNFEEITATLTAEETAILPTLINLFNNYDYTIPIKSHEIVNMLKNNHDIEITGARLRKLVNFIRSEGMLPLIATSKGYYVSHNKAIVKSQIQSLTDRADGIMNAANGLRKFAGDDNQMSLEL